MKEIEDKVRANFNMAFEKSMTGMDDNEEIDEEELPLDEE